MRARSGGVALILALVGAPGFASASPSDPLSFRATEVVQNLRDLVSDLSSLTRSWQHRQADRPRPQAIDPAPASGPTVDLSDLASPAALEGAIRAALRPSDGTIRLTVPGGAARLGDFSLGSNERVSGHLLVVRGNAEIYGKLLGNLVTLDGNVVVHPGAVVSGDILTLGGVVKDEGGDIGGDVRTLLAAPDRTTSVPESGPAPSAVGTMFRRSAGVAGVFLTLCALGFGLVLFARPNLEVVADTVSHSFGRAFLTGLLGQILLLPTFGMLVVGLVLSVAGILLLPFAVAVYALLVIVGVLGGYLAVAHAMGETYTRRRMALGAVIGSPNSYRYIVLGLGALATFWLAWAVFGWVPVAGDLIRGAAILVTWLLSTAGLGAALLSRAGIRESFAGRLISPEALTDEYLWATPQFGVAAQRRPGSRTPSRGL